ncbi:MAG: hypothetical protein ACFFGZ_06670 [Candidatus Thorarchaeota archaeon]
MNYQTSCNALVFSLLLLGVLGMYWGIIPLAGAAKAAPMSPATVKLPAWTNSTLDWKHTAVTGRASHPTPSNIAVATDTHLAIFNASGQTILEPFDLGGPGLISGVEVTYPGAGVYGIAWSQNGAWIRSIQAWTGTMKLNETFDPSLKPQIFGAELATYHYLLYWGRVSPTTRIQGFTTNGFLRLYQIGAQYDRHLWNYSIPNLIDAAISQSGDYIVAINGSHLFLWDNPYYVHTPDRITAIQNGTIVGVGHTATGPSATYDAYVYWANNTHLSIWVPKTLEYYPTGFIEVATFPLQAPARKMAVGAMGISANLWGFNDQQTVRYLKGINTTGGDISSPQSFNETFEFDPGSNLNSGPVCSEWGRYWAVADNAEGVRFYDKYGVELWHTGNNYTSVAISEDGLVVTAINTTSNRLEVFWNTELSPDTSFATTEEHGLEIAFIIGALIVVVARKMTQRKQQR